MLRVLAVCDKENTAIHRLAMGVQKYTDAFEYDVICVHPKRPDASQLAEFERLSSQADIVDWCYYKSSEMLRERYPEVAKKKSVLTMYNPYSIGESDWKGYDIVVACNKSIKRELPGSEHIPLAIDHEKFPFNDDWKPNDRVIMVANRIESKKGILEVAQACEALNLNLTLVGNISDHEYFQKVSKCHNVTFAQNVTDEELLKLYYSSSLHICNSVDNFESGTMPILEAMFCGVPVLTRNIGHVPDFYNGENLVLNPNDSTDVEALSDLISKTMADKKALIELREKGWQTAKNFTARRRAFMYEKLFRRLMGDTPVSVVMPVSDWAVARKSLNAILNQTHKNIEIVVCDDGDVPCIQEVQELSQMTSIPIQYQYTNQGDYGLARARNIGTIKATGDVIVYCDQRQVMEEDAVEEFVKNIVPRQWLFGNKGGKKDFVENFSCIYRNDIIRAGLFNERVNLYGGQSQEVRARTRSQGIVHVYTETAKATAGKSSNKYRKRAEIIDMKDLLFRMEL